ncbi:MAG: NUDIX hydrolase [Pseudomonadota bacterium]
MTSARKPVASVGVVVWRGDEVLLIQRGRDPYKGQWSIPGGKIQLGETARQAALRELKEETGVEARLIGLIDVVDSISTDWHYVLIDFAAEWTGGEPIAADDAMAAEFVSVDEARERLAWDETRRVIDRSRAMVGAAITRPESGSIPSA